MKVQGSAFYFGNEVESPDAKFDQFFHWLSSLDVGTEWPPHRPFVEGYPYRRQFLINVGTDYYCGVVLSGRATVYGHYVKQEGNVITVEARALGDDRPVEINFFCIRKDSGKGIYSHYYGSYSFMGFLRDLWGSYREFVDMRKEVAVANRGDQPVAAVERPFSLHKRAQYGPLFNPKTFEALVKELTELMEVRLTTYKVDGASDRPVKRQISNVHHVYRLVGSVTPSKAILDWIKRKRLHAGRSLKSGRDSFSGSVLGLDINGHEKTIGFGATLDDHLDYDYDQIGTFKSTGLADDPCVSTMIAKVRAGAMFGPG